jgi:hypothetical protein
MCIKLKTFNYQKNILWPSPIKAPRWGNPPKEDRELTDNIPPKLTEK